MSIWQGYLGPRFLLRGGQAQVEWQVLRRIWCGNSSLDIKWRFKMTWMDDIRGRVLTSFCFFLMRGFKASKSSSSQAPPRTIDQPSRTRSKPRFRPAPSRTINSTTISVGFPLPSPPEPKTKRSVLCTRSLSGIKTLQNLGRGDIGGGGMRNSVARCARRAGGCTITCARDEENPVCVIRGNKAEGDCE